MKKLYILPILSLFFLSGCTNQPSSISEQPNEVSKESNESSSQDDKENPVEDFEVGYNYEDPEWEDIKKDIEAQTGEQFQSLSTPRSPSNENVIFVSTSLNLAKLDPETENINKIYSYNLQTKELKELYKEENAFDGPPYRLILSTIGLEGNKLVLLNTSYDFSAGPCFEPLLFGTDGPGGIYYLDIENPEGLFNYNVPEKLFKESQEKMKKCQEETFPENQ